MKVVGFKSKSTYDRMGSVITEEQSIADDDKASLNSLGSIESIGSAELSDNY